MEVFGSADRYHEQVRDLLGTGVLRDKGMIYFDAPLSHRYPTIEIRVADVCLDPSTTVLLATLARGLVETASRQRQKGEPPARHGVALLPMAAWQACRYGLGHQLTHPLSMRPGWECWRGRRRLPGAGGGLRKEVVRLAEVLEAAEIDLDRRVIAREELVEALAAETTAVTEAEKEAAPSLAPKPGSTVPPWRDGLPVTVLTPDYQRILGVLEQQRSASDGPLRAREITTELGLETTPTKVEGVRSKARRLVERGWLLLEASGAFRPGRRSVVVPDAGSSV